jgi:hypothetical protein
LFNGAASSRRTEDCRINRQQASSERQLTAIKRSGDEVHQALASRSRWKNFMHVLSWITKGFDSSVPVVSIARLDSSRWAFFVCSVLVSTNPLCRTGYAVHPTRSFQSGTSSGEAFSIENIH